MDPLVYLPGLDGSAELLFMQEEELATRYAIHRVPWRTAGEYGHDDLAGDVASALDAAGVDRATVVAESFGGTVGRRFALAYPERVERLVLLNTFARYPNRPLVYWGRVLARSAPAPVVQIVRTIVDTPALALEGIPAHARKRFLAAAYKQPLAAYARRLDLIEAFDVRDRLGEISVPTLVVGGESDRVVPCDEARRLAERIPGAALRILPRVGHATLLTPGVSLLRILEEHAASARVTAARRPA
jgi:pimeloyl-ACP methyl ester carboxylesterase